MKARAVVLALVTAWATSSPARRPLAAAPAVPDATEPITIVAPRVKDTAALKTTRAAGTGAAVAGAGLMTYAFAFGAAGPVGWAAGLLFLGGMTAYLSHRRIKGHEDFSTTAGTRPPPARAAPAKR